ncbi:cell division protein SepF [Geodermatophilus sp. SYSU D00814]
MAGAMRKMGIYLGLVEDDDARAYGRYDARQADHHDRYDDGRYDERYDDGRYDERRAGRFEGRFDERADDRYASEGRAGAGYGGYDSLTGDPGYDERYDRRYDDERFDERAEPRGPEPRGLDPRGLDPRGLDARDDDADPEPALPRRGATRLGLATPVASSGPVPAQGSAGESRVPASAGTPAPRLGSVGAGAGTAGGAGGAAAAAGLAAREPVAAAEPAPAPQPYRITTLSPKTYNEARAIGEAFREGSPVIMNLTDLDHADARRLVDFAAGLIFGLRGSIEPVTAKVFLLSPRDVDVTAEDKARIREGGFFAQS